MPSAPLPKAARAAVVVALLLALVSGVSSRSGPIMLLGICFAALSSVVGILRRRAWGAWGFSLLLFLSILAKLFFTLIGQSSDSFLQTTISLIIYFGIAMLFLMAGIGLSLDSTKRGSPLPWVALAILFSVPFVFFRPMTISTPAMENTLLPGDFLLVDRFAASHPPYGQVIAFKYPLDPSELLARRVVGLPGDRIHITGGKLYRNGVFIAEPYVSYKDPAHAQSANFPAGVDPLTLQSSGRDMLQHNQVNGDIVVPPHKYFVLGDLRDNSYDSRNWGFVDAGQIMGHPKFVYDSLEPDPADTDVEHATHPPTRRWDRVFKTLQN